jgi:hypothetical protein
MMFMTDLGLPLHLAPGPDATSGEAITLMKRTLLTLAFLTGVPAMAQIPPEIVKTLTIVNVRRDDSFGCQNFEAYFAIASSFAKVEDGTTRNSILDPLLRTGECSRFKRGEQLYDLTISPGIHMVRRLRGGPSYFVASP